LSYAPWLDDCGQDKKKIIAFRRAVTTFRRLIVALVRDTDSGNENELYRIVRRVMRCGRCTGTSGQNFPIEMCFNLQEVLMSPIARLGRIAAIACVFASSILWSQVAQPVTPRPVQQPRVEPCWQVAGITKATMQERAAVERETHSQIAAVCADTALTAQQRNQQIHQIRQQAKQKQEALISSSQQEALQACQKDRAAAHPPAQGLHQGGGPCGEMAAAPTGNSTPPNGQPQSEDTPKENESPQN